MPKKDTENALQCMDANKFRTDYFKGENNDELDLEKFKEVLDNTLVIAEATEQDRANFVDGLQKSGKSVAYIGEGMENFEAIKKADLSICVQGANTHKAMIKLSKIVLPPEELISLVYLAE